MLDNINEQTKRILSILALAKCAVPLNYISLHTGIKDPLKILEEMEKEELVQRLSFSDWSSSMGPMFEITPKARKKLYAVDLTYANKSVFSDYCLE